MERLIGSFHPTSRRLANTVLKKNVCVAQGHRYELKDLHFQYNPSRNINEHPLPFPLFSIML